VSAALLDDPSLALVPPLDLARPASEVDIDRAQVALALAVVNEVVDDAGDDLFEIAGQVVVFERDTALKERCDRSIFVIG
jgi:hypothetical protein